MIFWGKSSGAIEEIVNISYDKKVVKRSLGDVRKEPVELTRYSTGLICNKDPHRDTQRPTLIIILTT